MADVAAPIITSAPQPSSPTKKLKAAGRKPRVSGAKKAKHPSNHPQYVDMISKAIQALKEHKGSSRQALLKYIMANFNVGNDAKLVNSRVKVGLKRGVKLGVFKQAKGTGAAGRFRLGEKKTGTTKKPKAVRTKKIAVSAAGSTSPLKPKKASRKAKSPKKPAAKKVVGSPAKPKKTKAAVKAPVAPKPKSPKKAAASKKPRSPKKMKSPKKAKASKKTTKKSAVPTPATQL